MTDIHTILTRFREAAQEKAAFAEPAEHDHQLHRAMAEAYQSLCLHGQTGLAAFRRLLTDPSPHVRSWVAAQLLSQGDTSVRPVLVAIAEDGGLIGFNAEMVLAEHDKGSLRSPFGESGA